MTPRSHPSQGLVLLSLSALFLAGCGGGGGGSGGMAIIQCSLQCNDSVVNPGQISCGITNVFVNQEIRVAFTNPIDPNSISTNSFRLIEIRPNTGKTPAGTFTIDAVDPRILIYRPQVTFDSAGNPIFGLTRDSVYVFSVPATGRPGELGPFISDTGGSPNSTFLECALTASEDVRDASPGHPRASSFVRRVTGYEPDGTPILDPNEAPAPGAEDVWRDTTVRLVFDDVMNPATLANPVTGQSSHIRAFVDADGNTADPSDQVALNGSFTVTIDQRVPPSTTVIFTPSGGLPSAGRDADNPRKIVISLSPQISDLGGNTIVNPGLIAFEPERILFDPIFIEEPFVDPSREDSLRTGSPWGAGVLTSGLGGGSGRLGDLIVLANTVVELDTDSEDFSSITNPAIFNPANIIERPPLPQPFVLEGGVFEFTRLRVDASGILRFKGSNPARVYVRGVADIQGQIEARGTSAIIHASSALAGGEGGTAGPNGGAGGRGGNRPDGSAFTGSFSGVPIGGVANPGAGPSDVLDAATYTEVNGVGGGGIAAPSTVDPSPTFVGGGAAGLGWPQPITANPALHMPEAVTDLSGLEFDPLAFCSHIVPAAPGGGGAHAFDGANGRAVFTELSPATSPPIAPGGDNASLGVNDEVRKLTPELGFLRGGGGGGGGGASVQFTAVNAAPLNFDCSLPIIGMALQISSYLAHSAAGGGGGGGGLQIAAGRRLNLAGSIDASGGDGGSGTFPPQDPTRTDLAQAGGGGAGGSVLLQAPRIQIQAVPGRINVSGGLGGEGSGDLAAPIAPSVGGLGSPGILRLESPVIPSVETEESKVLPLESELKDLYGNQHSIEEIFTTGDWTPLAEAPSSQNGAQSCWVRPSGNFFRLDFAQDSEDQLGWDMSLRIKGQASPQSYRGTNDVSPMTLEELFGTEFGSAPLVVRFQGARATDVLVDACAVPESGVQSPIAPNSLTEWLHHPGELNGHFADASLSSNMFRFVVIWDKSHPDFAMIESIEDITVTIQPD